MEYCIRCRHKVHPTEGWCAEPTGNHVYDTKCKCTQSIRSGSLEGIVRTWLEWFDKHQYRDQRDIDKYLDDIRTAVEFEIEGRGKNG